jgi:exopolysaccharide production protein ExoZ
MNIKRLSYIDALRGYAILGVIVVHVGEYVPSLEWPLNVIAIEGARGVQLFFVASALTLMLSWHSRSDGVTAFYIRRIFRIAPMFWLAIPLFLSLDRLPIVWPHILATALFVHGFHPETIDSIVPGGWTIGVEMTFYAVFPLLAWSIRSWQVAALAFAASIVGAALLYPITIGIFEGLAPNQSYEQLKSFSFSWFPTQLPAFLMGILTFHLLRKTSRALPRAILDIGSTLAILAAVVLPLATSSMKVLFVAYLLDFGLLTLCLGKGGGPFLVTAPIRYLGTISYSAYFWHFVMLRMSDRLNLSPNSHPYDAPGWLQFLVLLTAVAAMTLIFAASTYRLIEMPMIRLGRKLAANAATKPNVL